MASSSLLPRFALAAVCAVAAIPAAQAQVGPPVRRPAATPAPSSSGRNTEATPRRAPKPEPEPTPRKVSKPEATPKATETSSDATTAAAAAAPATPAASGTKEKPSAPEVPKGEASDLDAPGQTAVAFFSAVQKGQIDQAYATLTKGSKIAERPEELKTLKAKTTEAVELFGAIHGYELIESKSVGHNLLRRTYISLGADYPLRWRFYFYRSSSQWRLVDLRVDDRLAGIFDEKEDKPSDSLSSPSPSSSGQ